MHFQIFDDGRFRYFPLEEIDAPYVAELEKECFSCPTSESGLLAMIKSKDALNFIGYIGRKRCGYITSYVSCGNADILSFAVEIAFRSHGVGTLLLKSFIAECIKAGFESVTLEVRESNKKARHIYEKLGFEEVGSRRGYYTSPKENAMLYTLNLLTLDREKISLEN